MAEEREFGWDDEIENDNEFQILPDGDYNFTVTGFLDAIVPRNLQAFLHVFRELFTKYFSWCQHLQSFTNCLIWLKNNFFLFPVIYNNQLICICPRHT